MRAIFVDTWAYLALANRRDAGHEVALEVEQHLSTHGWVMVTSDWVLDETLTQLHLLGGAVVALQFLADLEAQVLSRRVQVLNVSRLRFEAALKRFKAMAPRVPRISLTDCCTFALMEELELRWAFTADKHFYAAGPAIGPLVTRVDSHLVFQAPHA